MNCSQPVEGHGISCFSSEDSAHTCDQLCFMFFLPRTVNVKLCVLYFHFIAFLTQAYKEVCCHIHVVNECKKCIEIVLVSLGGKIKREDIEGLSLIDSVLKSLQTF